MSWKSEIKDVLEAYQTAECAMVWVTLFWTNCAFAPTSNAEISSLGPLHLSYICHVLSIPSKLLIRYYIIMCSPNSHQPIFLHYNLPSEVPTNVRHITCSHNISVWLFLFISCLATLNTFRLIPSFQVLTKLLSLITFCFKDSSRSSIFTWT